MIQIQMLQVDGYNLSDLVVELGRENWMGPRYIYVRCETIYRDLEANPLDWPCWARWMVRTPAGIY